MNTLDEIQIRARQLSAEERADLALQLIQSLDSNGATTSTESKTAWLAECDRRLKRYESGEDQGVPLEVALQRARSILR
ncbi:MAG: addiction module antitoxin RelB [Deltaproteobacteria bacterium]|nr:addiction module antitoxin RelB [Deltaproteobacteria bacterium]